MTETISAAAYRALVAEEGRRRNKYGAVPVVVDGLRFDSTSEAERWGELCLLQRQGAIRDLRRQVRYPLVINGVLVATYVADFVYEEDGATIVEDRKGYRTPLYKLKKRLMFAVLGIAIRETGKGG